MAEGFTVRRPVQSVPLLDLKRQYETVKEEMAAALISVNESGQFVLGPEVKKLEAGVAEYLHAAHGVGCASGSDALLLALMAADVGQGDEVIVPSFTFFATASCVDRLGAKIVFADIDPETFCMDPTDAERKITERTKAIIPVHLYGQMADMKAFRRMVRERAAVGQKIALIEDAAQAIGAAIDGVPTGSWGDAACLSFYPTKNLGGAGDGGMLVTQSDAWAGKLRLLRGHGMEPRYYHQVVGINSRLDSYQAAVLNVKLPHLDAWSNRRAANAARYTEFFTEARLAETITLPTACEGVRHVWNQYVVRIPDARRDDLRAALAERKIGSEIYYPLGLHQQECFRSLGYAPDDLPETLRASGEVLALPMFPELSNEEIFTVTDAVRQWFATGRNRTLFPASEPAKRSGHSRRDAA